MLSNIAGVVMLIEVDASASIKRPSASLFGMTGIDGGASTIGTGGGLATSSAASPKAARSSLILR
jgi:hypothetical protein